MPFDVFRLREHVVQEYRNYVESFIHVLDRRIHAFVRERLAEGELWPEAVLQLNPAYEQGETLGQLAGRGDILAETARFFGPELRLHRHQAEALAAARRGDNYLVSTGTGSGKSLTYLVPIYDMILREGPGQPGVRALIVYPMNALINSQIDALDSFRKQNWPACPVRHAQYTGQTRDEVRAELLSNPPHILLTNYVMLEYMLLRPQERALVGETTRALRFLAVDELHVYRGRQGADVAMLLRRLRQRVGRQDLQCAGTSATIATEGDRLTRRARIAAVGRRLFGVPLYPANVIDETLQRVATAPVPTSAEAMRAAIRAEPPVPDRASVTAHPLSAWVEKTFGLATEDGRLVRAGRFRLSTVWPGSSAHPACPRKAARPESRLRSKRATKRHRCRVTRSSPFACTSFSPRAAACMRRSSPRIGAFCRCRGRCLRSGRAGVPPACYFRSPSAASAARNIISPALSAAARTNSSCRARRCFMRAATTKKASPDISRSSATGCGPTTRIFPTIGSILAAATSGSATRLAGLGRSSFFPTARSERQGCRAPSRAGGSRVR
jgi:hypothetical protein